MLLVLLQTQMSRCMYLNSPDARVSIGGGAGWVGGLRIFKLGSYVVLGA